MGAGTSQKQEAATAAGLVSCCEWAGGTSTQHLEVMGSVNHSLALASALETSSPKGNSFLPYPQWPVGRGLE